MRRWTRQIPNVISSLRILLVLPLVASLLHHRLLTTLGLFAVAALSDAADGYLARHFDWQSELGGILDPIADKLMLAATFITLGYLGLAPFWLGVAVVGRDAVIVLGAVAYRILIGPVRAEPSWISKINTLVQMAFILAVMGSAQFGLPPRWSVVMLGSGVFALVAVSGIDYVVVYGRRALRAA